jgi:outer membrane protein OmpA-like peptidoglycan-associated protein
MFRSAAVVAILAGTIATPAVAQKAASATPTVNSYLCTFAKRCEGQIVDPVKNAAESQPVGDTAGFKLATGPSASSSSSRGLTSPPASRVSATPRQTQPRSTNLTSTGTRQARDTVAGSRVAAGTRADLVVPFDFNSAQLTAQGRRNAQTFAEALKTPDLRNKRFLIAGYTDSVGSSEDNMALSRERAKAVADLLVSEGVERSRLQVAGYGESRPLPGHVGTDGANRRVEAILR